MQEILVILVIIFILSGTSKLPQIGKEVGEAIKNFKKAINNKVDVNKNEDSKVYEIEDNRKLE